MVEILASKSLIADCLHSESACVHHPEVFERGEGFVRHVPLAQNFVDDAGRESAATSRRITRAVSFSFVGLRDALSFQMLRAPALLRWCRRSALRASRQSARSGRPSAADPGARAARPAFRFPGAAARRFQQRTIVEIAMLFQPRDDGRDRRLALARPAPPRGSSAAAIPLRCACAGPAPSRRSRTAPPR